MSTSGYNKIEIASEIQFTDSQEEIHNRIASRAIADRDNYNLIKNSDGRILLSIMQDNGNDLLIEFENSEDMLKNIERILLNLELAKKQGNSVLECSQGEIVEISSPNDQLFDKRRGYYFFKKVENILQNVCQVFGINSTYIIDDFLELTGSYSEESIKKSLNSLIR